MRVDGDVAVPNELVIVRRRVGFEEEGHHGGAWKIAFADLMTAMMTFFLVMWLLSVSDKEKITKIASYFNPTMLSDKRPSRRGLTDTQAVGDTTADATVASPTVENPKDERREKAEKSTGEGKDVEGEAKRAEEELFNDPYGVLARMALKAMERGQQANGGKTAGEEALPAGAAFRNPFEPYATDQPIVTLPTIAASEAPGKPGDAKDEAAEDGEAAKRDGQDAKSESATDADPAVQPDAATPAAADQPPATPLPEARVAATDAEMKAIEAEKTEAKRLEEMKAEQKAEAEVRKLETDIRQSVASLGSENKPNIEVARSSEGLLISLTDDFRFGMFGVASAAPNPQVVLVMEKIAKVLATQPGPIVIRGHTDGRPFKSGRNDNWRLSAARAQVAYYMLVRGGIEEGRVERIEGHADRSLKVPGDPNAAQNRRIEILIEDKKP